MGSANRANTNANAMSSCFCCSPCCVCVVNKRRPPRIASLQDATPLGVRTPSRPMKKETPDNYYRGLKIFWGMTSLPLPSTGEGRGGGEKAIGVHRRLGALCSSHVPLPASLIKGLDKGMGTREFFRRSPVPGLTVHLRARTNDGSAARYENPATASHFFNSATRNSR